jgi:acetyl-CoA carboxylase carboxyl transferase subunit beta
MPWFRKKDQKIEPVPAEERVVRTENVFVRCEECGEHLYKRELEDALQVCTKCGYHFRMGAYERLAMLFDEGHYAELDAEVTSADPLEFVDKKPYTQRLKQAREVSGLSEAIITGRGKVGGHRVFAGAMDMLFIGGSMGSAVGEKVTRLIESAIKENGAVVTFAASGGARMQEGTFSLMQMAKIASALGTLDDQRLPFISVLTDPTTGGVTASFAMLGDVIIAEPKALIGFAGPRVIEQTIRQKLPKDFQRSEFLLEHGMIDNIVDRREMRDAIIKLLDFMMNPDINRDQPSVPASQSQHSQIRFPL